VALQRPEEVAAEAAAPEWEELLAQVEYQQVPGYLW
jgi:hypothetical protein